MTSPPAPGCSPAPGGDAVDERFVVRDSLAVRQLLHQLLDEHCMLRVRAAREPVVLTAIVRLDEHVLWIDAPPTDRLLDEWLASPQLRCIAELHRTEVRFRCGPPRKYLVDGHPTIALPLPESVVHIQRREFARREAPVGQLVCRVPDPVATDAASAAVADVEAVVRDISGGGMALLAPYGALRIAVGHLLRDCSIELPTVGALQADLRVCHVAPSRGHGGRSMQQVGCAFVDLSPVAQRKLFRYLMQLDRERAARQRWG